jgi:hypothetical protein
LSESGIIELRLVHGAVSIGWQFSDCDPYQIANGIFKNHLSTKSTMGIGLYDTSAIVRIFLKGDVKLVGTTYSSEDGLVTIGDHHGEHTGTVMKIGIPYSR